MDNEMNVKQAQVKKRDKKKLALILLIPVIAIIILLMYSCSGVEDRTAWLSKKMEDASEKVVQLDKDIMITEPITINGSKTISGAGRIIYKPTSVVKTRLEAYKIPDEKCEAVKIADLSETQAMFEVSDGASLTIAGNITIDGNQKGIDVRVAENGTLNVTESAVLKNGLGANVCSDGTIVVSGGSIQTVDGYNIMSNGAMSVEGGEIVGSGKRLMNIVSNGSLEVKGGTIKGALGTNVYVTGGNASVTGGTINGAPIDNVYVEAGDLDVKGGTVSAGKHGLHNAGTLTLTSGTLDTNTSNLYNEGSATVTGMTFGNSAGHNVVNTGTKANMVMKKSVIDNATTHAMYNILGAKLELEDFTVKNALSKGIHNGGGILNGKNITILRAGGAGVGNEKEKGWSKEGIVTIDNLKVMKAKNYNLLSTGGEMTITNAELGVITTHSIQVTEGILNLKDVKMLGTTGTSTAHGFYLLGGEINAENVVLEKSCARGIQNRGGVFNGKNITLTNINGTGIGQMTGVDSISESTTIIDGLVIKDLIGYALQNTNKGTMKISNAKIEATVNTSVRIDDGSMSITNTTFTGMIPKEQAEKEYGGVSARGGELVLNNVTFKNMIARGISNEGCKFTGKNIVMNGIGGTGICTEKGTTNIDGVTFTNVNGYNVDVKGGSATFSNGTFNSSKTASSAHIKDGSLTINKTLIVGAPQVVKADGTIANYYGVQGDGGKVTLNDVTIKETAGRGISNKRSNITAKNLLLDNVAVCVGTRLYNGADGTMYVDGLKITGEPINAYNVDNKGVMTLKNGNICMSGTTNLNIQDASETTLENVTFAGTTLDHAIFVKGKEAVLNMDTVTLNNTGSTKEGRAISNGGSSSGKTYKGGTIKAKNLVINGVNVSSGITNESGTIVVDGFEISNVDGYNVDVKAGSATFKNGTFHSSNNTSNVHVSKGSGSLTIVNSLIDGAPKIVNAEGKVTLYQGVQGDGGTITLNNVIIKDTAGRGIANNASVIKGNKVVIDNAGVYVSTRLYNAKGATISIDGLEILGEPIKAYNVENQGVMTLKNAELCMSGTTNINITGAETNLENVTVEGTTGGHSIFVKDADSVVNMDTVTINNSGSQQDGRGFCNGGTFENKFRNGGTVTAKNLVINGTRGTGIANESGTMTIEGLIMTGHTGYGFDNKGTATIKNAKITECSKAAGINNTTGELTVIGAELNSGTTNNPGIRIMSGTATLGGTLNIITGSGNAIWIDNDAEVETVIIKEGTKLESAKGINIPTDHFLTIEGMLGNTGEQPIILNPVETAEGTVYIETPDAQTAQNLAASKVFKLKGIAVVAGKDDNAAKLVAGTIAFDEEVQTKEVSTWAGLKTAIEGAKNGDNLNIVLLNNIDETDEGVITVGLNAATKVNLTDNGNGYTIKRTDLTKALFRINPVSIMTVDGKISVDGSSDKSTTASEAIFLNEGTLTIGTEATVKKGYKSSADNSLSGTGKSAGAIESTGVLTINGTVTTSGSGNYSAITVLSGTLTTNGAKLNSNIGRAARVASGTVTLTNTEICRNEIAKTGTSGAGLLIDAGTITVSGGEISYNKTNGTGAHGAGIYMQGSTMLTIENCTLQYNETGEYGGAIASTSTGQIELTGCTLNNNKAGTHGAAIRVNKKDSTNALVMTNCTVKDNTATQSAGAIISNAKTVTLTGCTFSGNKAGKDVGALFFNETNSQEVTLTSCTISGNTGAKGTGGIRIENGELAMNNCEVSGNTATNGNAGGIYATSSKEVALVDCEIKNNSAKNGGAINIDDSGKVTLTNCTVTGNTATGGDGGGAFFIKHASADMTVTGGSISDNNAAGRGGAVRIDDGKLTITSCTISNNTATNSGKSGGAFFVNKYTQSGTTYHGKVYLTSCIMKDNDSVSGKTIHVKGTLSLTNCKINDENVLSGYANTTQIYLEGSPSVTYEYNN